MAGNQPTTKRLVTEATLALAIAGITPPGDLATDAELAAYAQTVSDAIANNALGDANTAAALAKTRAALGIDKVSGLRVMDRPPTLLNQKVSTTSASIVSPYTVGATSAAILFTGNGPSIPDGTYARNAVGMGTAAIFEWWTDAPVFDIRLLGGNMGAALFIDDRLATTDNLTTDASGAPYMLNVDFTSHATPSKARHYRLVGVNLYFGGLRLPAQYSAWKPARKRPLVWALADSYGIGIGASPSIQSSLMVAAQDLGWDILVDGVSSSGWTGGTTGTPLERVNAKLAPLVAAPDVILWDIGYNNAANDPTAVAAAIDPAVLRARELFPLAVQIMVGPATPVGPTTQLTAIRDAMKARAAALGILFVDSEGWITASNKALYTDVDNVHPSPVGHIYLGHRKSAALGSAVTAAVLHQARFYTRAEVDTLVAGAASPFREWNKTTRTWPAVGSTTLPVIFISTNDATADSPFTLGLMRTEKDVWMPHADATNASA